jgi:hypothetical protein
MSSPALRRPLRHASGVPAPRPCKRRARLPHASGVPDSPMQAACQLRACAPMQEACQHFRRGLGRCYQYSIWPSDLSSGNMHKKTRRSGLCVGTVSARRRPYGQASASIGEAVAVASVRGRERGIGERSILFSW